MYAAEGGYQIGNERREEAERERERGREREGRREGQRKRGREGEGKEEVRVNERMRDAEARSAYLL